MSEKKLTIAQKRDRDTAALIAGIQKEYEDKIALITAEHLTELATTATDNYILGIKQGYNQASAAHQSQGFIDRLLNKSI